MYVADDHVVQTVRHESRVVEQVALRGTAVEQTMFLGAAVDIASLSDGAAYVLARARSRRDPRRMAPPERLAALLRERGLAPDEHVLRFEAQFGGFEAHWPDGAVTWLGVYAYLTWYPTWRAQAGTGASLVPIGEHATRTLHLSSEGAVFVRPTWADPNTWEPPSGTFWRAAESPAAWLEAIACEQRVGRTIPKEIPD